MEAPDSCRPLPTPTHSPYLPVDRVTREAVDDAEDLEPEHAYFLVLVHDPDEVGPTRLVVLPPLHFHGRGAGVSETMLNQIRGATKTMA